ncbi:MAG: protein kinase [Deltaproteobacteria bacterium]|nr:protein kinase [Deltaproteobacteria bacterium]
MGEVTDKDIPVGAGDILAGKYRIERVLGAGGMGVVVAAQHITLGQHVAIKFLLPHACAMPEAVERFLREARAAVRISSEHVARVSDVGTLETGSPYMVMEFLQGRDLGQVGAERGPLPLGDAVDFVLQACEAIAEAHSLGIVHRDLKPANLFLAQRADGSSLVKVLDFGISKSTGNDGIAQASMTSTTAVMGSPLYMSPEQMRSSKNVDARTDVWSLGVILYELLAGASAFTADTLPTLCAKILTDPPQPLQHKRPDLPPEFVAVIEHSLEKDPSKRFQNVAEFATALLPFSPKSRLSVERIVKVIQTIDASASSLTVPTSSQARPAAAQTNAAWGSTGAPPKSNSGMWIAIVAVIALLVVGAGIGGFVLFGRKAPDALAAGGSSATASSPPTAAPSAQVSAEVPNPVPVASASATATSTTAAVPPVKLDPSKKTPTPPATQSAKPEPTPPKPTTPKGGRTADPFDQR